jgi:hypothetical protein
VVQRLQLLVKVSWEGLSLQRVHVMIDIQMSPCVDCE